METSQPEKKNSQNSLNQSQNQQNKIFTQKIISDSSQTNSFKNLNQSQNQNITQNHNSSNNVMNTSGNCSFHESQSSLQNPSISNPQGSANFLSKEYFNFQFFKRQLSSQSSDIDFGADKGGLNDFFAARFNSVLSKDSSKPKSNHIKKSVDRISCDFDVGRENLSNIENKDEQSQFFSNRANSGCLNKSHNYIPKTFYFRRNNSNTPSCFFKKNNNNLSNNNKEQNLVLKF